MRRPSQGRGVKDNDRVSLGVVRSLTNHLNGHANEIAENVKLSVHSLRGAALFGYNTLASRKHGIVRLHARVPCIDGGCKHARVYVVSGTIASAYDTTCRRRS